MSNNYNLFDKRQNSFQEKISQRKAYEELTLMDSFLFEAVTEKVENATLISKVIIERATGRKVNNLFVETQKELKGININKHGIRMDVYTTEIDEDMQGNKATCVYDIEPNNYYEKDIPRRNRYYQSLIDSKLLPTSTAYEKLPDLYSIWILPYDPFGENRMVYTVKNVVTENNQIVYNDGVTKLFLYTKGTVGGSQELKDFLTFMDNPIRANAVDKELTDILGIVDNVRSDPKERGRYMGIMGVIDYERRDAYEEGLEKGQMRGIIETCKFMKTDREIAKVAIMEQFSITEDKAEEYLNLYW